jgi:hypothetical protein
MRAGWAYFCCQKRQTAKDFSELRQRSWIVPVLSIAGDKASAGTLNVQMSLLASYLTVIALEITGIGNERTSPGTMDALMKLL